MRTYQIISIPYDVQCIQEISGLKGFYDGCMSNDITLFGHTKYLAATTIGSGVLIFNSFKSVWFGVEDNVESLFEIGDKADSWIKRIDSYNDRFLGNAEIIY